MISSNTALAFALASVVLIVVPGPSVLFVIGRSLTLGRRKGLISAIGNELGVIPLVLAVAFGIGAVVSASVVLFTIIKFIGAAYLAYLGVQAIRHRRDHSAAEAAKARPASAWRVLAQGFFVGVTNPKSIVFLVAILPQFVNRAHGSVQLQFIELGVMFVLIALVSDSIWALLAGTARNWFATSPKRMERINGVGGGMMIGLSGVLLVTGNKH